MTWEKFLLVVKSWRGEGSLDALAKNSPELPKYVAITTLRVSEGH